MGLITVRSITRQSALQVNLGTEYCTAVEYAVQYITPCTYLILYSTC